MAISGTQSYDPSLGTFVIGAFSRCGFRRTQLTSQHMQDAYFEANMIQSEFQGDGIQTWQVTLETQNLIAGKSVYDINPTTVFVLDVYIRQQGSVPYVIWTNNNGYTSQWLNNNSSYMNWGGVPTTQTQTATDRIILPMSRSDYAAIANKYQQGFPTSYWWDRLTPSKMYVWPVPQADIAGGLQYYVQQRPDDAVLSNGTQVDIPYEVYDYFTWSLAERLAFIYAPEKVALIAQRKQVAYQKYLQATTENVPITLNVQMRGYFR